MERRSFLKSSAAVSAISILKPDIAFGSKVNSAIRMGFIGCGNRGTGVITAMSANTNINIIALADIFDDKLLLTQQTLNKCNANKGFADIQKGNIFQGSNAYLKLLDNKNVDAVLISTPAYAHPQILEAAVSAGKHAYCEKPAAIDIDGCKKILKVSENVNNKLSV
ncbi:MAG: Gfo/Idh/MocA family oxidoreductase, partial [Bacteroidota bacterium]